MILTRRVAGGVVAMFFLQVLVILKQGERENVCCGVAIAWQSEFLGTSVRMHGEGIRDLYVKEAIKVS